MSLNPCLNTCTNVQLHHNHIQFLAIQYSFSDKKISHLEKDMRDGVKFCELLKALNMPTDLPSPVPTSEDEKRDNLYHILSFLAKQQDMESDPEVYEIASEDISM